MSEESARTRLNAAITEWYAEGFAGGAVLTSWYVIASGTGFDPDGVQCAHIAQDWDADAIAQLGLTEFAHRRAVQRMDGEIAS